MAVAHDSFAAHGPAWHGAIRRHAGPIGLVLLGWLIYAGPLLSWQTNLYLYDTFCLDLPRRLAAARIARQGEFPHWFGGLQCGYPLHADGQSGVLYPPFLIYVLAPSAEGHDAFMALHYLLAAAAMYLFLNVLGRSPWASAIGGVSFMACSYLQSSHFVPATVATLCWMPLSLYLIERSRQGRPRAVWWCGLVNAVTLLAGHVHLALLSFTIQAIWLCRELKPRRPGPFLAKAIVAFVLPLGICAIQLWPTYQFLRESNRATGVLGSQLEMGDMHLFRLRWRDLVTCVWPDALTTPWSAKFDWDDPTSFTPWWVSRVLFEGYAAVVLIPLAILRGRPRREVQFWTGMLLAGLSLAGLLPLWQVTLHVPPFNLFRWPFQFVVVYVIAAAVLMAYGADVVMPALRNLGTNAGRLAAGGFALLCLAGTLTQPLFWFLIESSFYSSLPNPMIEHLPRDGWVRLLSTQGMLGLHERVDPEQHRRNARALATDYCTLFGLKSSSIADLGYCVGPRALSEISRQSNKNFCQLAAVTHVASPHAIEELESVEPGGLRFTPLPGADRVEVVTSSPAWLYQVRQPRPRAWMVHESRALPDREQRLAYLESDEFDPAREVVLERAGPSCEPPPTPANVLVEELSSGGLQIDVETPTAGLLVVADYDWPEFQATLDGAPREILRANHAFRAVHVPAGRHRVIMRIAPKSFYEGAIVTALALSIFAIGLLRARDGDKLA